MRIIGENTQSETDWFFWARRAFESTYGYEYQGDNLLLARENLLFTFTDYYTAKFQKSAPLTLLKQIANIIAWNVWQMDGLKDCVPFRAEQSPQLDLFADIPTCAEQTDCVIKDWRSKKILKFKELKGINTMKFDFVIGNPPYQEAVGKSKTQTQGNSNWIYQYFQFEADKISNCSCLIYPFGGWFDAPERLNGLGNLILNDKRTTAVKAYEGTIDKRAWYRNDKKPEPPFGTNANLSAGVSIVIRSNQLHEFFVYLIEYIPTKKFVFRFATTSHCRQILILFKLITN